VRSSVAGVPRSLCTPSCPDQEALTPRSRRRADAAPHPRAAGGRCSPVFSCARVERVAPIEM